jgi:hypothetical protein
MGAIALGVHGHVELRLAGRREKPDAPSLALAYELTARYETVMPQIQVSLFEHYEPYQEDASSDELPEPSAPFPKIERAEDVWPHVSAVYVLIEPLRDSPRDGPTIEIAYTVAWDEEHTVGARIQQWQLFELCGSVI